MAAADMELLFPCCVDAYIRQMSPCTPAHAQYVTRSADIRPSDLRLEVFFLTGKQCAFGS